MYSIIEQDADRLLLIFFSSKLCDDIYNLCVDWILKHTIQYLFELKTTALMSYTYKHKCLKNIMFYLGCYNYIHKVKEKKKILSHKHVCVVYQSNIVFYLVFLLNILEIWGDIVPKACKQGKGEGNLIC